MSEKLRNEIRPGFMRNFSQYILYRYIIIDDETLSEDEKNSFVSEINEALWVAIQETNIVVEHRVLPFVVVRRVVEVDDGLRIIINEINSDQAFEEYENHKRIHINQLSHLINFKTISPRRYIQVSDRLIPGDAKMIISHSNQVAAAVDIFLDIAMFNSVVGLKEFDIEHKHEFSKLKFKFAKEEKLHSYYECCESNPPAYWSLAFSARYNHKKIDYDKYVLLWNQFLKKNYSDIECNQRYLPPHRQMDYHRDKANFDKMYFTEQYWSGLERGDYLVVRINREPNDKEKKELVKNFFGISSFYVGAVKVIDKSKYYTPLINRLMKELYISAYKIVV